MTSLQAFTEQDIETVVEQLFATNKPFVSIEDAYQQLAQAMYDYFETDGKSDFALSRVYHSMNYPLLPKSLQVIAKDIWKEQLTEDSKLMILMGTYGEKPEWRDRKTSKGHRAILLSHEAVAHIPMVARLLQQIGVNLGELLSKDAKGIESSGISGTFGVFYVAPALDSPYIPAQDFVVEQGVQSVIGTGVVLPQGDISVYIGFSRVHIESEVAANIASLMSSFWQHAFSLLEEHGMFTE